MTYLVDLVASGRVPSPPGSARPSKQDRRLLHFPVHERRGNPLYTHFSALETRIYPSRSMSLERPELTDVKLRKLSRAQRVGG